MSEIVAFYIGAGAGGLSPPATYIQALGPRLIEYSFDAKPDAAGIEKRCFWKTAGISNFYHNRTQGSSGLLPVNPGSLGYLMHNGLPWRDEAELVEIQTVETETLDHYCVATDIWPDFLSLDIQGAEYDVLDSAPNVLTRCLALTTEVEFRPLYDGQKLFSDLDLLLRRHNFQFMALYNPQLWRLHPQDTERVLSVGEALYLRRSDGLSNLGLEKLQVIAGCFGFNEYLV